MPHQRTSSFSGASGGLPPHPDFTSTRSHSAGLAINQHRSVFIRASVLVFVLCWGLRMNVGTAPPRLLAMRVQH